MLTDPELVERVRDHVGPGASIEPLKHKPGRRRTVRARGPRGSVICKLYASDRAGRVAARVAAVAAGPAEPAIPRLVGLHRDDHLVVLSDVPGRPLGEAIDRGDEDECRRAGEAIGAWHAWWRGYVPDALLPHTLDREREILTSHLEGAPASVAARARAVINATDPWRDSTAVHRDLYEEQVLTGGHIGLIDLDDAAAGPPELDVGNLLAHLLLRVDDDPGSYGPLGAALLAGYTRIGELDLGRLDSCIRLSLLRLACIHDRPDLADRTTALEVLPVA